MTSSHRPADSAAFADRALTDTPLDSPELADRRETDRLPTVRPARAEIHRLGMATGPDFADELIDVSADGIKVRFCLAVRRGERFDVTLWGPGGEWCGRYHAVARWVDRVGPATTLAGLELGRPLPRQAVGKLTTPMEFPAESE